MYGSSPLVVSDGRRVLLDSATSGDEPYMLASNLPGVAVRVDRDRVKAARYAVKRLGCDTVILDDGFQYQKLKHTMDIVLVDATNPFGNGNMLPRGILREPARRLKFADVIFLTKCRGDVSDVEAEVRKYNTCPKIVKCDHVPVSLKDVWSREEFDLGWLRGKTLCTLSGIASPKGFENSLRRLGSKVGWCEAQPKRRHGGRRARHDREGRGALPAFRDDAGQVSLHAHFDRDSRRCRQLQASCGPHLFPSMNACVFAG